MKLKLFAAIGLATLVLSGCAPQANNTVTLIAHDSFAISDESIEAFETQSGYQLEIIRAGDAGSLTNRLVLTKASPIADVVFGIDNTFRPVAEENKLVNGDYEPIDFADVCFNYDSYWFKDQGVEPPTDFRDLVKPEYKGLTVITNPNTSSPGLAFLATTVAAFGEEGYENYWEQLKGNEVLVSSSWEDAYFTQFSGSSGEGNYPIVLSYSSSPAAEIREDGKSQTVTLGKDCFRQTEYAGVLKGAANPEGAKALIDFLKSKAFQDTVAELMYVYPINQGAQIPAEWAEFGKPAESVIGGELNIEKSRSKWLKAWLAIFD